MIMDWIAALGRYARKGHEDQQSDSRWSALEALREKL